MATRLTDRLAEAVAEQHAQQTQPDGRAPHFTTRTNGDTTEHTSVSASIRTVEDLLAHIQADMTRFEVAASEATKWDVATKSPSGQVTVTELHRVWVRLKPRGGPGITEAVEAMVAAARKSLRSRPRQAHRRTREGLWQVLVVADPHFAKYAWGRTTGWEDCDLAVIDARVRGAAGQLCDEADSLFRPVRRTVALLGDVFHYDTPHGTTTSGTPLERDGRLPRMVDVGMDAVLSIVERSAETCQTDVLVVAGNHDEVLSVVLHKLLRIRFAGDRRISLHPGLTNRVYLEHGRNLMGFAHGHRARDRLATLMPLEASAAWARCPYREFHTGHLHGQHARVERPIQTVQGVVVRTAPSLCPPDDWHANAGFVGNRLAMETFLYGPEGGLDGMLVAGPNVRPSITTKVEPCSLPTPDRPIAAPGSTSPRPSRRATRR
jgi:hypothetical protein